MKRNVSRRKAILCGLLSCFFAFAFQRLEASTMILGALDNPGNFDLTTESSYLNYSVDLNSWEYEVRLPTNFDTNKTYGLITFIDSGVGGFAPAAWKPALDEHDLIWLGGKNNGNTGPGGSTRRGVALMGAFRMTELYNIDTNRIFACGNSGGSRAVAALTILRPDIFAGVINNVGSTFANDLPEKFTDPTSSEYGSYEYAGLTGIPTSSYWDDNRHFDPSTRWVTLTAYTDFREDELMNLYHLGHINFGNTAKLISRDGDHGYKEYQDFNDAINFIEHPLVTVVEETFSNGFVETNPDRGRGFSDLSGAGASISETTYSFNGKNLSSLKLDAGTSEAVAEAKDRFSWDNPYGIILDARMRTEDTGIYNQQQGLHILKANTDDATRAGFNLLMQQTSHTNKHVQLLLTDTNGASTVLFEFDFDTADEPLDRLSSDDSYFGVSEMPQYVGKSEAFRGVDVRIHLWDQAIQFTFGQDIDAASFSSSETPTSVKLMDDHRIVQAYFDEVGITGDIQALVGGMDFWKLWLSNKALMPAASDAALFDDLKLISSTDALHVLTIHSGNGAASPPEGSNFYELNTVVTCQVDSVVSGTNQLVSTGWIMTGNEPASGSTNAFIMTLANDAVLAWQWQTNALVSGSSMSTNVVEDAYIRNGDATPFGFDSVLRLSSGNEEQGFLKFSVDNVVDWNLVESVVLRVRAAGDMSNTTVCAVEDTGWRESTINGLNEPAIGSALDVVSNIVADSWYEFDVSDHITSNGTWSLGMKELGGRAAMLANGDFELPDQANSAPITDGGWSDLSAASHVIHAAGWASETGDQGVWMRGWNVNQNGIFHQDIPVNPAQEYTLVTSFKLETNFEGNGGQIDMELVWLNSSGVEISRGTLDVDAAVSTASTWEHLSLTSTSPVGAASVRAQIHWTTDGVIENSTASSAMLDNMELTTTAINTYDWYSRESGFPPQLVISSWVLADADSDGDGLRDGWEVLHFDDLSTTDGTGDFDGDTFIDLHEFLAGTDPKDDTSFLRIEGISALGGNQHELTWASVDGIHYRILHSTHLVDSGWGTNQTGIIGTAPLNVATSSVESSVGYFSIEVE